MDSNTAEDKKRKVLSDGFKKAVYQMIKEKHFKSAQAFADFLDDNGCRAAECEIGNRIYSWTGNKTSLPDIVTLVEIAKVCGCSVDFLLGLSDCRSVENDLISQRTGLDDNSLIRLEKLSHYADFIIMFNRLVSSPKFGKFVFSYSDYFESIGLSDRIKEYEAEHKENEEMHKFFNMVSEFLYIGNAEKAGRLAIVEAEKELFNSITEAENAANE